MLHSPMIGIMELISNCYSVQLVRLPLHPQSSHPPLRMVISIAAVASLILLYTSLSFLIHISVCV